MREFTEPVVIRLSPELIDKAKEFAKQVVGTVNYRDSNQSNMQKIQNDHFISKLGEEAVRLVFERYDKTVVGPDYTIYSGKNKSWDEDLTIDSVGLAVKTQKKSAALRYGLSWIFQSSGYRTDPILTSLDAWVCFVECDDNSDYECKVFPPYQIKELTFKEPKLDYLKGKKRVVYADDL